VLVSVDAAVLISIFLLWLIAAHMDAAGDEADA
jgi:hypothetical protein